MNRLAKLVCLLLIFTALLLALPGPVYAQNPGGNDSPVIFGSDYLLLTDQTIQDLVVFGGNATLQKGSTVKGDVVIFGGNLIVAGMVQGDVTAFGGNIRVDDSATVGGDLNTLGGLSNISPEATVKGNRVSALGGLPMGMPTRIYTPGFFVDFGRGAGILSAIFGSLFLALLAVLVTLFLPIPTERVAQTISTQPVISGGVGLLTLVITPALFLVLAITIILIPLGLIGLMVFGLALLFGWVALGLDMGQRMAKIFNTGWAVPVSAGLGTLVLSLVVNLALVVTGEWWWLLCCVGLPLVGVLMMVGLGGVIASKFGANVYTPNRPNPLVPPAPGSWPMPQNYAPPPAPADWAAPPPVASHTVETPAPGYTALPQFIEPPLPELPPADFASSAPKPPDLTKPPL